MLKRCYYTNCLLPYYVDDNEPTDTNEDHPLSTTDIDKSDDRPLWEKSLPPILKKPRFIAAVKKAIQQGYIVENGDKLIWTTTKAELGFFVGEAFGYASEEYGDEKINGGYPVPYQSLETLFNEKRLDRTVKQTYGAKKEQPWRSSINNLFS